MYLATNTDLTHSYVSVVKYTNTYTCNNHYIVDGNVKCRPVLNVHYCEYINGGDVQRKNVVNNVDKSSLWAP